jgi:hypothetical protein
MGEEKAMSVLIKVRPAAPPLFEQSRQPVIAVREFNTDRALVLGQRGRLLPPRLGPLAIGGGVPVVAQCFASLMSLVIKLNGLFNLAQMDLRWGRMDTAADLITRATRYRALAARVTDEPTRAGLRELAEKYEALAREIQADGPPEASPAQG